MAIKIGQLAKAVMVQLNGYSLAAGLTVEKVVREVAQDTAKELQQTSPRRTGDYAESWTYDVGNTARTKHTMIVHAEDPHYRLTHLLENGHQVRKGGRTLGNTKTHEHIAPAEKKAVEKLRKMLEKRL